MKRNVTLLAAAVVVLLAVVFGARLLNRPAPTTGNPPASAGEPRQGGTLNLAMWNKPAGALNPIVVDDTYGENLQQLMYAKLWEYDGEFKPEGVLATHWEWDETNTKLTFHLNPEAKFFDGTPVTAKDVVFTYKAIWHPRYVGPRDAGWDDVKGYAEYSQGIKGETPENFADGFVTTDDIEGLYAVDEHTVVFELNQPNAAFLENQIVYAPVDSSKYKDIPVQDWGRPGDPYNIYPNGTGPYKMEEYVEGQYALLVANENYVKGRPNIDRVLYRIISPDVAVGEMQIGNLDFVELSPAELASYQAMDHVAIHEFPDLVFQHMVYNTVEGPTSDVRVRHAINYAIDRQAIIDNLLGGHGSTMYGPVHPLTWAYTEDLEKYEYNPDKARQILDEAGWIPGPDGIRVKNGQRLHLRLIYPNEGNPVRQATAPVVQQFLKDVGIEVELIGLDWPSLQQRAQYEFDFDLYFIGFQLSSADPDPTGLWDKASTVPGGFNTSRWWTEKSEELIAKGKATSSVEERTAIYHEWAKHWAEESPSYIFYATNTILAANERLQGFKPIPREYLWNIEDLWLLE